MNRVFTIQSGAASPSGAEVSWRDSARPREKTNATSGHEFQNKTSRVELGVTVSIVLKIDLEFVPFVKGTVSFQGILLFHFSDLIY